jgi:hypothetical protein
LSSAEESVEVAEVSETGIGCEDFTRGCLSSVEDSVEASGISVGRMGCEDVTCGYLSSAGVEATGVSGAGMGCEDFTCDCLSSVEDGVEAAGGHAPEMARAGSTVWFIITVNADEGCFKGLVG